MPTATPEEALRWEARQGPRAAIASALGAVLVIGSGLATAAIFNDAPGDRLRRTRWRARGRTAASAGSRACAPPYYEFYDDRALSVLLTALARGVGFIAVALMLAYLASAVRSRTEAFKGYWIYVALVGGVGGALATVLFTFGTSSEISSFLDGSRTVDRADAIGDSSVLVAAQLIGIPGTQAIGLASLALGLAWVVICLNAMRIGLLTRFMGVLGVICGALIVLPILSPLPIVQTFWLGAMALLLAGRWPSGLPPAWVTGEAQPWPSSAELRAQRQKATAPAPPRVGAGAGARARARDPRPLGRPRAPRLAEEEA